MDIIEALKNYETLVSDNELHTTPKEYTNIKRKFLLAKKEKIPVLIESSGIKNPFSITLEIDYVGDRWCQGHTTYHRVEGTERVPYTIHYGDIYAPTNSLKIIFKGENPYRIEEGTDG